MKINGETLKSASLPSDTTLKPGVAVRGVLATESLQYTDRLASGARDYRTARVVFMVYDEDYRPHVESSSFTMAISDVATWSNCGSTKPWDTWHSCSLELQQSDFPSMSANATLTLTGGASGSLVFQSSIVLSAIPSWSSDGVCDHGVDCSSSDVGYVLGPAGAVQSNEVFTTDMYIRHTNPIKTVVFWVYYDSSVVSYVDTVSNSDYPNPIPGPEALDATRGGAWKKRKVVTQPPDTTDWYTSSGAGARLIVSVRLRALSEGEGFSFSIEEVTGGGNMVTIGSTSIACLGSSLTLTPSTTPVGLLAAMKDTVAAMASVTGEENTYEPHVVRVSSDYGGSNLAQVVSADSCTGSSVVSGCVTTTSEIDGSDVSLTVTSGALGAPLYMKTYTPSSVEVRLDSSLLRRMCSGGSGHTFEATRVAVLADGIDVTNIAQLSHGSLVYDATMRTLRASTSTSTGSPISVSVGDVVKASVVVDGEGVAPAELLAEAFTSVGALAYDASTGVVSVSFAHSLTQQRDTATVHGTLKHADGTTEPVDSVQLTTERTPFDASGRMLGLTVDDGFDSVDGSPPMQGVNVTYAPLFDVDGNTLEVNPNPTFLCGVGAFASSTSYCAASTNVSAFLDVPSVQNATLSMTDAATCIVADGSDAHSHCSGTETTRTLQLSMTVKYSDGTVEEGVPVISSRADWTLVTCGTVSATGSDGEFTLTLTDDSEAACAVVARVDGLVSSNGVSACVEQLSGVRISATYHPHGSDVTGLEVTRLPCDSSKFHRVELTAQCATNLRNLSAKSIAWAYGSTTTSANNPIVEVASASVPVSATLGSVVGSDVLTQSSTASTVSAIKWHLPSTLSLVHGASRRYRIQVDFDNKVRIDDLYAGTYSWVLASDFISCVRTE